MSTEANSNWQPNYVSIVESDLSETTFSTFTMDIKVKVEKTAAKSIDGDGRY
ncbi:hypothetical protein X975_18073, partial [Stegodyphus mimosarum]